jgi:CYTH domain-containing protein
MEIERKFLIENVPDLKNCRHEYIEQGYLCADPEIRIRNKGNECFLTVKGNGNLERTEYETRITFNTYEELSMKVTGYIICKTRYRIPLKDGTVAELDIYNGYLNGLITVEVEFDSVEAANTFEVPDWFGEEVTDSSEYKNKNLSF